MSPQFYRVLDDVNRPERWFLGGPTDAEQHPIDAAEFLGCHRVKVATPLHVGVRVQGKPLDFTLADFEMPVVTAHFGAIISRLAPDAVQLLDSRVDGYEGRFAVVNALDSVPCLDEKHSDFEVWEERDGEPDLVGRYKTVFRLRLLPNAVTARDIFRVRGWEVALIVSSRLADQLAIAKGIVLEPA